MLASHTLFYAGKGLVAFAAVIRIGTTRSVKAIKMSAKLTVGRTLDGTRSVEPGGETKVRGLNVTAAGSSVPSGPEDRSAPVEAAPPPDPLDLVKSRSYVQLLVLAGLVGIPVSAAAYGYLKLVSLLQQWMFASLPKEIGFKGVPTWWPLPLLALAGLLVACIITYLPGTAGHKPAEGFKAGGAPTAIELPGVLLASLATLSLGVVLGPEAPLIAIGGAWACGPCTLPSGTRRQLPPSSSPRQEVSPPSARCSGHRSSPPSS